jgi:hypothetical protein
VNLAGEQPVVQRARAAHGLPANVEPVDAQTRRVFLDQSVIFHHHLRQEGQAVLLAELDAGDFGGCRPDQGRHGKGRGKNSDREFTSVHVILPC